MWWRIARLRVARARGQNVKNDYVARGDMLRSLSPRRFISSLAVACALIAALPAHAQDATELKKARAQFQQATELEQAGNWTAALQAFREVGQVRMTPQ